MILRILILAFCGFAASLPTAAAEEGGGSGSLLITPQFGTIFWTVVTFVLLAIGLRLVAWKPLLGAIEERERTIRDSLESAGRQRAEAEALLAEHRDLVVQARKERAARSGMEPSPRGPSKPAAQVQAPAAGPTGFPGPRCRSRRSRGR